MSVAPKNISKTVQSRTDNLSEVREFVASQARTHGFSEEEVANIVLAVDEACTNIIKHAYQNANDMPIDVSIASKGSAFEITIADDGKSFDPSMLKNPDLKDHLTHFRRGGLGVYLMKKLMDAVEYQFQPGQKNRVRLVKYLPGTAPR
jgi:serine/threonine-protein kinase RsbW